VFLGALHRDTLQNSLLPAPPGGGVGA
jgi:hypothetical protein